MKKTFRISREDRMNYTTDIVRNHIARLDSQISEDENRLAEGWCSANIEKDLGSNRRLRNFYKDVLNWAIEKGLDEEV